MEKQLTMNQLHELLVFREQISAAIACINFPDPVYFLCSSIQATPWVVFQTV